MSIRPWTPAVQIIEGDFSDRIHEISPDACSFDSARGIIEAWRAQNYFSVFSAGAYDVFTLNHLRGLMQSRVLGAMSLVGIEEIETEADQQMVHEKAASDAIRLMVTLDTNRALEEGKSRRPDKGGAPKPILDWRSRAMTLATQFMPTPDYNGGRKAVDYITRHGPECCDVCQDGSCTNEDNATMALKLQPNLVVVNAASTNTVQDMRDFKNKGWLPNTQVAVVVEDEEQYHDPILGGPLKTTAIIERARQ